MKHFLFLITLALLFTTCKKAPFFTKREVKVEIATPDAIAYVSIMTYAADRPGFWLVINELNAGPLYDTTINAIKGDSIVIMVMPHAKSRVSTKVYSAGQLAIDHMETIDKNIEMDTFLIVH